MHIPVRMRPWLAVALSLTMLALPNCTSKTEKCELNPEVAKIAVSVQVERLEKPYFQIKTPADAEQFIKQHPLFARQFLQSSQYPPGMLGATLARLATNTELRKLGYQADTTFQTDKLNVELKQLFQHIKYYFPDFQIPPVKTFVSGLSQDLSVSDSLLVISTDFFIGPKAAWRPKVPQYILRRYTKPHALPMVALSISSKYNQKQTTNQTMLGEMVQFGKALYFAEKVLPCTPDSLLIGYTNKEIAGVAFNEGKIWAYFIEKNLLYNTAPFTIQKYVGERPNIPEIDKTCPGRVGAWVGWQIVRKYMAEHPNVTLKQLMAEKNAQHILNDSKYRPKPRRAER
ncbi:gliding motility-associated lipoprotein GldB [Hymenobacter gelipurpurascens]|uniref:Gliding motility-associated lipoprotein GldB n=1 Tax=Hymenobacter gelipurpurascens TaxID=89968 RepID=A0A212UGU2_9BACT|nr:gliding motility lipoprotein GldB [Hymenobacter gelipurpurascens]SNC77472.1 gliding motility-associated lipoprotein GldB [Hymenobacter gelipurpurascens]